MTDPRHPDDDFADLLAGREVPAADARLRREAGLLRRAIGAAVARDDRPADEAERRSLEAVRGRLRASLAPAAGGARPAANDAWYAPRRLAIAASLMLAVGLGILVVRTGLPPEAEDVRAPAGQEAPAIYSRDPAAQAEAIRSRLAPLGVQVAVSERADGARLVEGRLPDAVRQEGGRYLDELGVAVDATGAFRTVILPSARAAPPPASTAP